MSAVGAGLVPARLAHAMQAGQVQDLPLQQLYREWIICKTIEKEQAMQGATTEGLPLQQHCYEREYSNLKSIHVIVIFKQHILAGNHFKKKVQ